MTNLKVEVVQDSQIKRISDMSQRSSLADEQLVIAVLPLP